MTIRSPSERCDQCPASTQGLCEMGGCLRDMFRYLQGGRAKRWCNRRAAYLGTGKFSGRQRKGDEANAT